MIAFWKPIGFTPQGLVTNYLSSKKFDLPYTIIYSIGEVKFFRRQIGREEPLCFTRSGKVQKLNHYWTGRIRSCHAYNPWLALLYQSGMCMDDKIMENVRKTSIYRIMTSEIGITNMKCILFSDRSYAWHGLIMEGGRGHSSFSWWRVIRYRLTGWSQTEKLW